MFKRDRLVRQALKERFVATLRDGQAFDGLLIDADEKTFRFADAYAIDARHARAKVDGALYLSRAEVLYLQKPGSTA